MMSEMESFIEKFNTSWTKGQLDDLSTLLDENVIFLLPDLNTEIQGIEPCIQTFKDYLSQASTNLFKVTNQTIRTWSDTAVVNLDYYVDYEYNGQGHQENGKEFWILTNQNGEWKMVWRSLVMNNSADL